MDDFDAILRRFDEKPTIENLNCVSSHLEMLSEILSKESIKKMVMKILINIRSGDKYSTVREDDAILRLYKIAGKVSQNVGSIGIYQQMEKKGMFRNSLKFYLLWAEECAIRQEVDGFKGVLNLARERLSGDFSIVAIEAGFRDLADEYLKENVSHLFVDADDTMRLFDTCHFEKTKKAKRRSSVGDLRRLAPQKSTKVGSAGFGTNTRTLIRPEFIDTCDQFGVSPEEYRNAAYNDAIGDVDMNKYAAPYVPRRDSGIGLSTKPLDLETHKLMRDEVENRISEGSKRRHLSIVDEEKSSGEISDVDPEKKARTYSPLISTNDAQRIPLRKAMAQNNATPATITLSSDTKISSLDDVSFNYSAKKENRDCKNSTLGIEIDDEKLRAMGAGRRDQRESSNALSSSSLRTAKSSEMTLMAENNCIEAHAMFSDTVHLGSDKTMNIEEPMQSVSSKVAQNMTSDFSVLCDPDPTFHAPSTSTSKSRSGSMGLNVIFDEGTPDKIEQEAATKKQEKFLEHPQKEQQSNILSPKSLTTPPSHIDDDNFFDESIVLGLSKSAHNIITSTPACGIPFVGVEEYFGNSEFQNAQAKANDEKFVIPSQSSSLHSKLMKKRKSLAPNETITENQRLDAAGPVSSMTLSKKCDESLSEQLGRRLSLGSDEITAQIKESERKERDNCFEETGIKNRRRSEIIRGEVNPWDEKLRSRLMKMVRPPTNMHELNTTSPRIQAMKTFEIGGETYSIGKLLGQGGYAKVYKAENEENDTIAVKVEVPSCAWEVYICDQLRNRLIKKGGLNVLQISDQCIMQVIDAYIFTNCSLLINEYHEYGTLLDYANNQKDPNWHISCFLITQMAKVIREVHEAGIIHSDIKPDNFMITRKIDMNWQKEDLMSSDAYVIKLIDWGRSIDMISLKGHSFSGAAGTDGFDCPEMRDGRPWSFQADYFGFAATMAVMMTGKYCDLNRSTDGEYSLVVDIKRRNVLRQAVLEIMKSFLNIPSNDELPDWNRAINLLMEVWDAEFDVSAWRQSAIKFNEGCEKART